jgi:hypothetical protein
MALVIDPMNPLDAGFRDAYLRGQMDILKFVLGISEDRKSDLQKHLEEVSERQHSESSHSGTSAMSAAQMFSTQPFSNKGN